MRPAEQRQVGQGRRAASRPPDQVMPVAPGGRPRATWEDAVAVARLERAAGRRRERPSGVIELVLELALAGDAADRRVTGVALDRLGRYRAATLELTRRCALRPGQGVETGADDQLRPWARAIALAAGATLPAKLDQGGGGVGKLLELAGDLHTLHGGAARQFALPAQPGRQRERAVGLVLS